MCGIHRIRHFKAILGILLLTLWGSLPSHANVLRNTLYDVQIRKWSSFYTPEVPWYWNKAQLVAESNLNPNAVSPVGAMGLGQFMPATWKDVSGDLDFGEASAFAPSLSIQAHAYYMRQLRSQFKRERPERDRHSLALASYNAGLGNVLKAQKLGGDSLLYEPMAACLHKVTGYHSKETLTYVHRIWSYITYYENN